MSIWVLVCKYVDLGKKKKFRRISILVKIFESIDFGENGRNNSNLVKKIRKISILVKFVENSRFWSKSKKKCRFLVKI